MSKDYVVKKERLQRKMNSFIKENNKTIKGLSLKDVEKFMLSNMKAINRSSFYGNVRALNDILKENGNDIVISSKDYVDECVKVKDEQYYTKREIIELCDILRNAQDKFILYALWNGIMGKTYSDLLNIKVSDVAEDYSYIMVNGKKFMCDDYMKRFVMGTIYQDDYIKTVYSDELRSSDFYEFNMNSEYLIKVKPTKRNNNGLDPMGMPGLTRKLDKIQEIYFESCGEKLIINGLSLVKSGIMYDMFQQEVEDGKEWSIDSIGSYLKLNGYKINANELYRVFWNRYHGSNIAVY